MVSKIFTVNLFDGSKAIFKMKYVGRKTIHEKTIEIIHESHDGNETIYKMDDTGSIMHQWNNNKNAVCMLKVSCNWFNNEPKLIFNVHWSKNPTANWIYGSKVFTDFETAKKYFDSIKNAVPWALQDQIERYARMAESRARMKKYRVEDTQRKKVYRWESKVIFPNKLGLLHEEEAQNWINSITKEAHNLFGKNVEKCNIFFKINNKLQGGIAYNFGRIEADRHSCYKEVLIHELAHVVNYRVFKKEDGAHGPTFVAVYIKLLEHFLGMDKKYLIQSAKENKVKVKEEIFIDDKMVDY